MARREAVNLQHAHAVLAADCSCRGVTAVMEIAHAARAAIAEQAIAFVVAITEIDRVQIIP